MSYAPSRVEGGSPESLPAELITLLDRVRALPPEVRTELEPAVSEALEQARFRGRILDVARDALERLRFDLELARFDLDATRREREHLRRLLQDEED
jgi:nitric oxide reductase activation protein